MATTNRQTAPTATTDHSIRMRGLVKTFGKLKAVNGLDLEVPAGQCVGLLGPNGAGKSTTIKALTAQVIADQGELEVLGHQLPQDSKQARAEMGVVPQLDNLDTDLTVEQNLLVFTYLYRIPNRERQRAIKRALKLATLTDRRKAKISELSGGMRRRLLIARALLHQPKLILMDEPTVGLDPQVRQELWALIDKLRSDGVSILMSTHYIEEAERLCDTVTIMSHGKAIAQGSPKELIQQYTTGQAIEIFGTPERLQAAEKAAKQKKWSTRRTGTSVMILNAKGRIPKSLQGETRPANLEDVFVLLTGETIE